MPRIIRKNDDPKKNKRRSRPDHDDDSSVDSHGNVRDLIVYEEEYSTDESMVVSPKKKSKGFTKVKNMPKPKPKRVIESDTESEESEETEDSIPTRPSPPTTRSRAAAKKKAAPSPPKKKAPSPPKKKASKKRVEESEEEDEESEGYDEDEEDEDEDEGEDEEEYDSDEDDEEYDSDEEDGQRGRSGLQLLISDINSALQPPKPKKYKLKQEPENVRRFVRLVQTEVDPNEEDIDRDIGYFKALSPRAQDRLLTKLHNKVEPAEPTVPLKFQILSKEVPDEVERVAMSKYAALQNIDPSSTEYYKASQWIHGYTQLPLGIYKDLPVKLEDGNEACQKFVTGVRENMDSAIYGHEDAKLQILQFVSSWIANPQAAGNVLSIHGPPGVGKTTLIKDGVAKALGRPFHFITLGGATDASFLDGHSYTYEGSTWGRIVDVLIKSKCMNPVIYFDELDKVSDTPKGEEINNLLIHLTDGSQNDRFQDKYFTGIDLDLSRCLFIFSHNAHERVNPILRDRMYNIQVDGFGLKEKLVIADQYLVSQALREVNLFEKIGITKDILTYIIEHFTGAERGVRELKRAIQTVVSKINLLRFYNDPTKVPFAIKGFALPFTITRDHIDVFLKDKKPKIDPSIAHLYC